MKLKKSSFIYRGDDFTERILEEEFNTIGDIRKYLEGKGINHSSNYHHYTNIDSLLKILSSKSILLSRMDKMNDKEETTKILPKSEEWKNVFSLCMSCSEGENMALWGLYSIPYEKGVRISFSKNVMNTILKCNRKFVEICGANYKKFFLNEINLIDVLYMSNNKTNLVYSYIYRRRNDNYISNNNLSSNSETELSQLIGCIKNDAWRYENEVRLRVNIENKMNCDKIKISLPEIDYSEITIMFSPFVSSEDRVKCINKINSINIEYKKIVYEESIFSGLVNLKTICPF